MRHWLPGPGSAWTSHTAPPGPPSAGPQPSRQLRDRAAPTSQAAAGQHGTVLSVPVSGHSPQGNEAAFPLLYVGQGD